MKVKYFAKWVKKNNPSDHRKSILAYAGFAGFAFLFSLFGNDKGIAYYLAGSGILILAALGVGRYQWERYFNVTEDELSGGVKPISQVVRLHVFPVEEYFAYVGRQMKRPFWVILSFSSIMAVTAWGFEGKERYGIAVFMLGLGIVCGCCTYAYGGIKKKQFLHQLKMGQEGVANIFLTILSKIWAMVEVLFLICTILPGACLFWIVLQGLMELPIEETGIVLRNYRWGYSIFAVILSLAAWLYGFCNHEMKKLAKVMYVLSFLCLIGAFVLASCENHIYTEFAGDEFRIHDLWKEEVYGMEEIESFRIYEDHESIQMELVFGDRVVEKIFGTGQTSNDLYEKAYDNEYEFLADYVDKLQKLGAEGKLEDVEMLKERVAELNPKIQEGWRRILELMEKEISTGLRG